MNRQEGHAKPGRSARAAPRKEILAQMSRLIISIAGVLLLFYCARSVVLPVMLAWMGSMVLRVPVTWLRQHHIPAPLGAGVVMIILTAALGFGLMEFGRPVANWIKTAPETLPRLRQKYHSLFAPITRVTDALNGVPKPQNNPGKAQPAPAPLPAVGGGQIAGTLFSWTGAIVAGVAETGVLMFLMMVSGDPMLYRMARILQTLGDEADAMEVCRQIQHNISKYLFSVSLINIVLGLAVGGGLALAGMPNAAMWGALATLANFVPYFGPVAGIMVVALAGLISFDTVTRGLLPAGIYLICHVLEADCLTPLLLGRRFRMNPFVIFVMLMFCAWLWGVLGALLAMPLLVTLNVVCSRVPAFALFGEFLAA
ncbi:MAG TPA: AI-2E family transporter [Verrucomicrobiae bacterium]|jgi:predicted PurR-regulated permease PerM